MKFVALAIIGAAVAVQLHQPNQDRKKPDEGKNKENDKELKALVKKFNKVIDASGECLVDFYNNWEWQPQSLDCDNYVFAQIKTKDDLVADLEAELPDPKTFCASYMMPVMTEVQQDIQFMAHALECENPEGAEIYKQNMDELAQALWYGLEILGNEAKDGANDVLNDPLYSLEDFLGDVEAKGEQMELCWTTYMDNFDWSPLMDSSLAQQEVTAECYYMEPLLNQLNKTMNDLGIAMNEVGCISKPDAMNWADCLREDFEREWDALMGDYDEHAQNFDECLEERRVVYNCGGHAI